MRKIININKKWAFSKESKELPKEMPTNWYWVNIPHTWNNIDGQDGDDDYYRGKCYYAKEIIKEELPEADRYYLEICGANSSADVFVNNKKLAHHDGGYSTWRVDITDSLKEINLIVLAVDNSKNKEVYPQNADYTFYGGLYRDVNIIAVNNSHFDLDYYGGNGIKVTPEIEGSKAKIDVSVYVTNEEKDEELLFTAKDKENNIIMEKTTPIIEKNIIFNIENVHLWDGIKDPYLYKLEVYLLKDKEKIDYVSTRFGCRTFKIDAQKGFILNGKSYPLRGVSRHQDRWGYGNALLKEQHKEDMDLICEMGANSIRLAHYQHDQYFYDLCDKRGIIVWAEIPYISEHMEKGRNNAISQMKELIIQNYNHPCIAVWGLSNEITVVENNTEDLLENHRILNDLVHQMDKTRLTTVAVVSMCNTEHPYLKIPDAIAYNHYFGWYMGNVSMNGKWLDNFHEKYPNTPIGLSEYGCEALDWHSSNPVQGDYTEEYQAYYHEELIKQIFDRQYLWATYVWNMFDFGADARNEGGENGQNHKGLVTFDRKYKKDAFYAYKAWLSDKPFVHICGKRYVNRVEDNTKITVYSNLPQVKLFVNDKCIETQERQDHFFHFNNVPNIGRSHIVAIAGNEKDESYINKVEKLDEKYIFKEKGLILNWFDITAPEGYYSLNDKISDLMKSEEANNIYKNMMEIIISKIPKDNDNLMIKTIMNGANNVLGEFSIIRLINMAKLNVDKDLLLEYNAKLNKIKKV